MPFKFTVTEITPFPPNIVGDQFADLGLLPDSPYIPSAVSGFPVDFDVKFEFKSGEDTAPVLQIFLPNPLGVPGLTASIKSANTINIKGTPAVFTDEIWEFVFPNGEKKILDPYNSLPYKSIVKWAPPSKQETEIVYKFKVKYDDNPAAAEPIVGATVDVEMKQFFYWKYEGSLALFKVLAAKGPNY